MPIKAIWIPFQLLTFVLKSKELEEGHQKTFKTLKIIQELPVLLGSKEKFLF